MQVPFPGAAPVAPNGSLWPATAGILGVFLIVAAVPGALMAKQWMALHRDKVAWTIAGPACPTAADAGWTRRPIKTFDYGGATFSRRAGHAYCATLGEGLNMDRDTYPVCQFTGPVRVTVKTGGQTLFFKPGPGRKATVAVRDGVVSCVVAGWFAG